jgi:hypothetical protein
MENLETWMKMFKIFDLFGKWQRHILKFLKTIVGGLSCNKFEKLNAKVQNIFFFGKWQMKIFNGFLKTFVNSLRCGIFEKLIVEY